MSVTDGLPSPGTEPFIGPTPSTMPNDPKQWVSGNHAQYRGGDTFTFWPDLLAQIIS